jgi:hypothetical protein
MQRAQSSAKSEFQYTARTPALENKNYLISELIIISINSINRIKHFIMWEPQIPNPSQF